MKKYYIILWLVLFSSGLWAQGVYNNGGKIVIGSGVTLTVSGTGGNYLNETNGSLDLSGTLKLEGNLTNNAVSDVIGTAGAGSKVELIGTSAQTIGGTTTATFTFPDLTVNNASGVVVAKDAGVTGTFSLTNGLVDIGNNNFNLGSAATVTGTPSVSSMIVATGTGQVRKEYSGSGSFTFPIGDNSATAEYSPVTLSLGSGTFAPGAYIGLSLSNTKYASNSIAGSYLNRYWNISQTGITGFSGNALFQYQPADVTGTEADISLFKIDPAPVVIYGAANVGLHQLTASGLTGFGTFTGGNTLVAPVAGNSQTVCFGFMAATLNANLATGGSGTFSYQWQESLDFGVTWFDLVGETTMSYDPGYMFSTDYYRIKATDLGTPSSGEILSNVVIVTANEPLVASVIGTNQTICYNSIPALITATTPATGGTGPLNYQWQRKTTGGWSNINGATDADYQPIALTQTTQYQQIVHDNGIPSCGGGLSNVITITVEPLTTPGSLSASQSVCLGAPSAPITGSAGTGAGTISYEWERSINGGSTWTPIPGEVASGYTPGTLSETTQYRRTTVSTVGALVCRSVATTAVTITVNPLPAAQAGSDVAICAGISTPLGATAVAGSEYIWSSAPTGFSSSAANPTVTPAVTTTFTLTETVTTTGCSTTNSVLVTVNPIIPVSVSIAASINPIIVGTSVTFTATPVNPGANPGYQWYIGSTPVGSNSPTFTSTTLADGDVVKVVLTAVEVCNTSPSTSTPITMSVTQPLAAVVSPATQTICFGFASTPLIVLATGASGSYSYQWEESWDNGTTWSMLTGETTESFDPGTMFSSAYYRVIVSGIGVPATAAINSNEAVVTTNADVVPAVIAANQTICYNNIPAMITSISPSSGGTGPLNYQWQRRTTGGWSNIGGAVTDTYQPLALTQTTQFRQIVNDGGIPSCPSKLSNVITVTVQTVPLAGSISGNQPVCSGSATSTITSATAGTGSGTISYEWESSTDGGTTWDPFVGQTSAGLSPGALVQTTMYHRITVSTLNLNICRSVATGAVTITVNPLPAAVAGLDVAICAGASTTLGAAAVVGNTYSWTSDPAGYTSATANPSVSPIVNTTYFLVETITATGCTNTHSVVVTVNPLPDAVAGSDVAICTGASTTLGAAAVVGNTYSWTSVPAGFTSTASNPTVSPLVTTTYSVVETVTATGCTNTNSVTVTVNPLPAAIAGADRAICLNGNTSLGDIAVIENTYSWTSVPAGFTSTASNPTVSPLVTTTYSVVETITATGCTNTNSVTVTVNPLPAAIAGADRAICLNASTTLGAAAVVGNTYAWSSTPAGFTSTEANPTVSPLVTTIYTVIETITATGCTNTHSVVVTVNPLPAAVAGADRAICLNASTTLGATAVIGNTYAWSSVPAGFTSTEANPTVTPSATTTYSVVETVTATGCTNTHSVVITVNPLPAAVAGIDRVICLNASTTIGASAVAGSTYSWTSVPAGFTSTSAAPTVTPLLTTTYTVVETITATGCIKSNSVIVTVNPLPAAIAVTDRAICLNASTTLGAAAVVGSTYSWTSVPAGYTSTTANPSVTPLVNTTYTLVETITATGCTNTNSVVVTVNELPAAVAGTDRAICLNASTTLGAAAVAGSTYSWSSVPAGFTSTAAAPTDTPLVTTTYTVVETITATGCTHTNSVIVTVNPLPAAIAGANRDICLNTSTILGAAAVAGSTYSWTSSPAGFTSTTANPTVTPLVTTTYTVVETVTATGCTSSNNVTITVNPLPAANAGANTAICLNTGTTLGAAAVAGNTYSWTSVPAGFTSSSANPTVTPTVTTTYTLVETITATSCTNTNSVVVTVNSLPIAAAGANRSICTNTSTQLGAAAVAGSTYAWVSSPAGFTSTLANPTVTPLVTTTYTVTETITATGCSNSNSVTVTTLALPVPVITGPASLCVGSTNQFYTTETGMTGYTWTISAGGSIVLNAGNTLIVNWNTSGAQWVRVSYTNGSGCTAATPTQVDVIVNPLPTPVLTGPTAACAGSTGLVYTTEAGMTNYTWSISTGGTNTSGGTSSSNTMTITWNTAGAQWVRVSYTNANGCNTSTPTQYDVTVNPLPVAVAGANRAVCLNSSTTLGASPVAGNTYSWTSVPAGFTSTTANPTVTPLATTIYTVVETVTFTGCTISNSVVVTVNPLPVAAAGTDRAICLNSSTTLGAAAFAGSTYSWTSVPAGFTSAAAAPTVTPLVTTTYTVVEAITATGCTNTNSVVVTVNPLPAAVAGASRAICLNGNTSLGDIAVIENTYSWTSVPAGFTSTASSPTVSPLVTTTYSVVETVTATGCTNTNSVTVTVNPFPAAAGSIAGSATFTPGATGVIYSDGAIADASSYTWAYSGSGVTINGTTNSVTLNFATNATDGQLSVSGTNLCGNGTAATFDLSSNKTLGVTVYLEGPYNTVSGQMNNTLNANSLIPLSSEAAYTSATYNYIASNVTSIPNADIVDWVLVELRDAATPAAALPATKLAGWPKAFFIKADGSIVGLDGTSLPSIGNPAVANNLYIVVIHRNHIAVMSATGISLTGSSYLYNFSTAITQAYGDAAGYKQIGTGVFGMVSGDADADGNISVLDFSEWSTSFGLNPFYLSADIDLDVDVTVLDFSQWSSNFGLSTPAKGSSAVGKYKCQVPSVK